MKSLIVVVTGVALALAAQAQPRDCVPGSCGSSQQFETSAPQTFIAEGLQSDPPSPLTLPGARGASYLITVKTLSGVFDSRGVITLHADHTMSVIDSLQGGPTFFFSSQLGSWTPAANSAVVARTIDFDFPSVDVVRLDYTMTFSQDLSQVTGTIKLTSFSIQGDPLNAGGTVDGKFTFTGQLIKP